MAGPHFTKLPPNTDDPTEQVRYACSMCDLDVFHISVHAQFDHDIADFTVDNKAQPRPGAGPKSLCSDNGCSYPGGHEGTHSWQNDAGELAVGFVAPPVVE